jgi:hypothetical protein
LVIFPISSPSKDSYNVALFLGGGAETDRCSGERFHDQSPVGGRE